MAIKFQYNKTSLQELNKQLKVRQNTLPTIKNKESALRLEVKKTKNEVITLANDFEEQIASYSDMYPLWGEFDQSLLKIDDVILTTQKIAGVQTPVLEDIKYSINDFFLMNKPSWYYDGITILKLISKTVIEKEVAERKLELLEYARKKTTQKVNLYEKVQIPGLQDAILKIKRYLEDEDNLTKSAQKIVKARQNLRKETEE